MLIRPAMASDCESLRTLRNHYIINSYAVFLEKQTSVEEANLWQLSFSQRGPSHLYVATDENVFAGFAFSAPYDKDRAAHDKTVKTGICLNPVFQGAGLGTTLYKRLINTLSDNHIHTILAEIALPNEASVALHRKTGFDEVGILREYAVKHGVMYNALLMQLML